MGRKRRLFSMSGLLTAACAVAAVAAVTASARSTGGTKVTAGGTYRVGWESSFGFTDSFDPTGEYLVFPLGIYSNLMIRTRTMEIVDLVAGAAMEGGAFWQEFEHELGQ